MADRGACAPVPDAFAEPKMPRRASTPKYGRSQLKRPGRKVVNQASTQRKVERFGRSANRSTSNDFAFPFHLRRAAICWPPIARWSPECHSVCPTSISCSEYSSCPQAFYNSLASKTQRWSLRQESCFKTCASKSCVQQKALLCYGNAQTSLNT